MSARRSLTIVGELLSIKVKPPRVCRTLTLSPVIAGRTWLHLFPWTKGSLAALGMSTSLAMMRLSTRLLLEMTPSVVGVLHLVGSDRLGPPSGAVAWLAGRQ